MRPLTRRLDVWGSRSNKERERKLNDTPPRPMIGREDALLSKIYPSLLGVTNYIWCRIRIVDTAFALHYSKLIIV